MTVETRRQGRTTMRSVLHLVAAYVICTVGVGLSLVPFNLGLAAIIGIGGTIFASPLLLVTLVTLVVFKKRIDRDLERWCYAMPFLVTLGFTTMTAVVTSGPGPPGSENFWTSPTTLVLTVAAFFCSAVGATSFYLMERR